jgi:hypothetical protein
MRKSKLVWAGPALIGPMIALAVVAVILIALILPGGEASAPDDTPTDTAITAETPSSIESGPIFRFGG